MRFEIRKVTGGFLFRIVFEELGTWNSLCFVLNSEP